MLPLRHLVPPSNAPYSQSPSTFRPFPGFLGSSLRSPILFSSFQRFRPLSWVPAFLIAQPHYLFLVPTLSCFPHRAAPFSFPRSNASAWERPPIRSAATLRTVTQGQLDLASNPAIANVA